MSSTISESSKPVQEVLASFVMARTKPLLFCDLLLASGKNDVIPYPLFDLMSSLFFECFRQKRNLLIQAPPEHGKTSLLIPSLMWVVGHLPRTKIGVVSRDSDLVARHLTRIRKGMLTKVYKHTFPKVVPDYKMSASGEKGAWSQKKLYIKGEDEPTFEGYSLFGAAEGHRLDLIWMDDCVTRECLYSEAARRNTASAMYGTFGNRLTSDGMMLITNNCWHREDAIHQAKNSTTYTTFWVGYRDMNGLAWEIINPPVGWEGPVKGVFPLWALWSKKRLIEKQKAPGSNWKRLFGGIATSPEESRFVASEFWIRYDEPDFKSGKLYGFLDPSGGRSIKRGDFAACIVILAYPDKTFDLIDCMVRRTSADNQRNAVFEMHEKWARVKDCKGFRTVGIEMLPKEENWLKPSFELKRQQLRDDGNAYWQVPYRVVHPIENKEARIEILGSLLENGWLRFPPNLTELTMEDSKRGASWRELVYQLEEWPFADHDDGPDALAGCIELAGGRKARKKFVHAISVGG